ncbi:DUF1289 domain-containing protein [Halioxenophilus sp. WMMB6]|uniref:DUF1289 domain-containing protein n=1 Tax=Halioxenophilus sp. WMMB6 TaxID=3073815 RepID=UPI00295EAFB2|nr:DUF1289 domain-containing protein [Halioxenophilus sp. WMMB6]
MPKPVFRSLSRGAPAEKPVNSPCVSICVLNEESICTGCFRTGEEISRWGRLTNRERRSVLALCIERAKRLNPFF